MVGAVVWPGFPFEELPVPQALSNTAIPQRIAVMTIRLARNLNSTSPGKRSVGTSRASIRRIGTGRRSLHRVRKNRTCSVGQMEASELELVLRIMGKPALLPHRGAGPP